MTSAEAHVAFMSQVPLVKGGKKGTEATVVYLVEPPLGSFVKGQYARFDKTKRDFLPDPDAFPISFRTEELRPYQSSRLRTPRSLQIFRPDSTFEPFIEYLARPEAGTRLSLEARNEKMDYAVREQYRKMTGISLVEGQGYNVAPDSARKEGCEGSVTFKMPEDATLVTPQIRDLMKQRLGFINRIDFVWMLIERGFRVSRA